MKERESERKRRRAQPLTFSILKDGLGARAKVSPIVP